MSSGGSRPDTSTSLAGLRVGSYEVQNAVGAGAMGEVYRARDTRLGRDVALKILPPSVADEPDRLMRFEREARALAALNHPHIAQIYGIEEIHVGRSVSRGIIMEFVDGETLAERLTRGRVPLAEAVPLARQIAEALEAAHEKGIIHRDLKPANIKITPAGAIKVLDFGLAKSWSAESALADVDATGLTIGDTQAGMILGTASYMSPEQARGKPVDKRTDVWAFGCVLFEMLSGQRAFEGATVSDVLAAVLEREPAWNRLPSGTPSMIRLLLGRCFDKDRNCRLRDIGEARIQLTDLKALLALDDESHHTTPSMTRRTAIATLAGATVGAAVTGWLAAQRQLGFPLPVRARFAIPLTGGDRISSSHLPRIAISPDGAHVALNLARAGGPNQLVVRPLHALELTPPGEGVKSGGPFFSSDGRWLGYLQTIDGQMLRKVALSGGAPVTVATYPDSQPAGATWGDDDAIYFVSTIPGGIMRVPSGGGTPTEIAKIDFYNGERLHKWPAALPASRGVLFTLATEDSESFDDTVIAVVSPTINERKILIEGGTAPRYSPSGHIVYARSGRLVAVAFDADRLQITGQPFTVLDGVMMSRNTGVANFDISATGDLVYVAGTVDGGARHLVWVDRSGHAEKIALPARSYLRPRLSPDGRRLAIEVEGSNHDIFVFDFATGVFANVTTDGVSHWPVWSPDGTRIGYRSGQMGQFRLWQVPADRSAPARQIRHDGPWASVEAFSPDGASVVYTSGRNLIPKLAVVSLVGDTQPRPLDDSKFAQGSAKFSPDGKWLAYCSNESGQPHVYVQAFPGPGPKVQLSTDGGTDPVWRRSGGELFYRHGDRMMAVAVTTATFAAERPRELWRGPYSHGMSSSCGAPGITSSNYDVTPDGQRFLMIQDDDSASPSSTQVIVVQGWADGLRPGRKA